MEVSQPVGVELFGDGFKRRLRRRVGDVVERVHRRQPDADAARFPDRQHRLRDLAQQAGAVGYRAAVAVRAMVRAVTQELVEQVAVGGMDLDSIEAGRLGLGGGTAEVLDQRRDLGGLESARRLEGFHALFGVDLAGRADCRGRHWQAAIGLRQRVGDTPDVPQLQEDLAVLGMNGLRHAQPAGHLFGAVDARRPGIPLALRRDLRGLGNDQTGTGALRVVARVQGVGHVARCGAAARQRRHHDAVAQRDAAEDSGREQGAGSRGRSGLVHRQWQWEGIPALY